MGLDVSHYKLIAQPVNKDDFLHVDDWNEFCNVPLVHYESFITDIVTLDFSTSINVFESKSEYEKYLAVTGEGTGAMKDYIGKLTASMYADMEQYIQRQGLGGLKRFESYPEYDGIRYFSISFGMPLTVKGMYYEEVGYQRKGMNNDFYDHFGKQEFWGRKEDFELAYNCVGDDWYIKHWGTDAVARMREEFRCNFVDRFEFGRSLLSPSF